MYRREKKAGNITEAKYYLNMDIYCEQNYLVLASVKVWQEKLREMKENIQSVEIVR